MKNLFHIIIFTSAFSVAFGQGVFVKSRNGTVKRQKQIVNQNCVSNEGQASVYADQHYLADEPKSVSEKKFQNYILSNNPNPFPLATLRFCVIFQPNLPPCCRQIEIADSLTMDTKQIDFLTDLVLKYPVFSNVQFDKDEKIKYLVIYLSRYKKSEFSAGFGNR
ncbi:MAG: hypothetical protein ACXVPM_20025 [Bacteroidia bacterium]